MPQRYYSSIALETQLTSSMSPSSDMISLASTTGFPPSTPFTLAVDYAAPNEELVEVTAISGLTLTITRAFDGTSATSHNPGATVRHVSSAIDFTEAKQHEEASAGVHGLAPGDTLVGTDATQTLHNKTLDRATGDLENINIFNTGSGWSTDVIGSSSSTGPVFVVDDNETDLNPVFKVYPTGQVLFNDNNASTPGTGQIIIATNDVLDTRSAVVLRNADDTQENFALSNSGRITVRSDGTHAYLNWTNPDGTIVYGTIASDGRISTTKGLSVNGAQDATFIPLNIHGVTGQTADLVNVRDTTNTTNFLRITPAGQLILSQGAAITGDVTVTGSTSTGSLTVTGSNVTTFTPTISGHGTATFTSITGTFTKLGSWVMVKVYAVPGVESTKMIGRAVCAPSLDDRLRETARRR